ncbi:MAG: ABC transporter permease subunit [Candidatus Nanopelagicales bacterium]
MSKAFSFIRSEFQIQFRSILGWSIAIFSIVSLTNAFFPSIKGSEELDQIFDQLPEALQPLFGNAQLSTPMGYLLTETYLFFLPAVLLVYAIGRGAYSLAGEEEAGTLDLLLAQPISRIRLYFLKSITLSLTLIWLSLLALLPTLLYGPFFQIEIPAINLISITIALSALVLFFGLLSQGISAATGSRAIGIASAASFAFLSYLIDGLGQAIEWLEKFRVISPWKWYNASGSLFDTDFLQGSLILIFSGLIFKVIGITRFNKRNLAS